MKSIVFCSSQRFAKDMYVFMDKLADLAKQKGVNIAILHPEFEREDKPLRYKHEKDRLDDPVYRSQVAGMVYDNLFRKVKVADVCFVYNKDGYIGVNTSGELFAAAVLGKMIYAFDDKTLMGHYPSDLYEEPSVRKLVHEVVSSPAELLSRLS